MIICSFCNRNDTEVESIVGGHSGNICNDCIEQASEILARNQLSKRADFCIDWQKIRPKKIKQHLDQYVIGQAYAKEVLSIAVYNHYKRLFKKKEALKDVEIQKSNLLFVGPTGVGKTYLVQTIAKFLKVPFCSVDATTFTQAGYVGEDVEGMLSMLLKAANYNIKEAERGIIYIDEIDKIARKTDNPSITRDVGGEGVQQALLKIIEGSEVNVPPKGGRKHPEQKLISVRTHDILIICGGAFDGIKKTIQRRLQHQKIGFEMEKEEKSVGNLLAYLRHEDLKAFGLIPELLGRLPVLGYFDEMTVPMLKKILTTPKNALIKQYQKLLAMDGVQLQFTADAVEEIALQALHLKLGARGLRRICEQVMHTLMFDPPFPQDKEEMTTHTVDRELIRAELAKRVPLQPLTA